MKLKRHHSKDFDFEALFSKDDSRRQLCENSSACLEIG